MPFRTLLWEVDVFAGENEGLVIAEVELDHEHQHVDLPSWVGAEVTRLGQYYNGSLAQRPFCTWDKAKIEARG